MSDFQDFARTVMGRSFGSQNNSNQDPGKTLAIAILMYPPQVAWFMDNGAYPSEGYVNNKEKIDWINDELHRLNAYYGSPIYPGLHSFGVRKSSKTRIDKYGNLKQWWNNRTIAEFRGAAQCIIEQYNNYTLDPYGLQIDGRLTQGENIADNGGLKQAYRVKEI